MKILRITEDFLWVYCLNLLNLLQPKTGITCLYFVHLIAMLYEPHTII
jgi:hypothetical protein